MWASSWSRLDIPAWAAMSRENAATAAQWRAARLSRSSSVRTRLLRTPHDSDAYSRVRSCAVMTRRAMYVKATTLRTANSRTRKPPCA